MRQDRAFRANIGLASLMIIGAVFSASRQIEGLVEAIFIGCEVIALGLCCAVIPVFTLRVRKQ